MIKTTYELAASLLSFSLRRLRDRQNRVNDLEQGERQRLLAADHSGNVTPLQLVKAKKCVQWLEVRRTIAHVNPALLRLFCIACMTS